MKLLSHGPEPCASANSATLAIRLSAVFPGDFIIIPQTERRVKGIFKKFCLAIFRSKFPISFRKGLYKRSAGWYNTVSIESTI